jgi:hypothetical protein
MGVFDIIAGIASIVGLVLTGITLSVAKDARDAAREAKEAVYKSNAESDFEVLTRLASEFLDKVQNDHASEALLRGRDLIAGMAIARKRWDRFLDKSGQVAMEEAGVQIQIAVRVLASYGANPTPKQKDRLCKIAGDILSWLGTESGKIRSSIERTES